jgi:5'-deoxynucleotidase YfbR-like HD superfamily hydrolase
VKSIQHRRESGAVERCHTTPHHGSYSVGLHCYNVAQILLCLHPSPSVALVEAALCHDHLERWLGDVPAPAKWKHPMLDEGMIQAEDDEATDKAHELPELDTEEANWLGCADSLELIMWCDDQLALGNQHVAKMRDKAWQYFRRKELPAEMKMFINSYSWSRSDD